MEAIDDGYTWEEVCRHHEIPRTSLRDHMSGRTTSKKMGPAPTLTTKEEGGLVKYLADMVEIGHPLNTSQLKSKVAEITQCRHTPFRHGILRNSWLNLLRARHPHLVLREPQPLDSNRPRALCPSNVEKFYSNLSSLMTRHNYQASQIWNIDESGV